MIRRIYYQNNLMSGILRLLILMGGQLIAVDAVSEEWSPAPSGTAYSSGRSTELTDTQLQELVGPIALYPDDLIGIILPASTNPLQLVQAVRFLEERKKDTKLSPDENWDDAIIALLNYPEVLEVLDGNLDWTVKLGEAVIAQQDQVLAAIQEFRKRANSAGNLVSDSRQTVVKDADTIQIAPADPQVIYIPEYEPEQVIVRHYVPSFHYYPVGYPVYYYPYTPDYRFSTGFFWGVSTAFVVGWNTNLLYSYRYNHHRHPYYRSRYYENRFLFPERRIQRRIYPNRNRARNELRITDTSRSLRSFSINSPIPRRYSDNAGGRVDRNVRGRNDYFNNRYGNRTGVTVQRGRNGNYYDRAARRDGRYDNNNTRRRNDWDQNQQMNRGSRQRPASQANAATIRLTGAGSNNTSGNNNSGSQGGSRLNLSANNNTGNNPGYTNRRNSFGGGNRQGVTRRGRLDR